jgi:hypothetical protein
VNHSTCKPTDEEQERLDAIHALPCVACAFEIEEAMRKGGAAPIQPFPTEAHHINDKGYRKHSGGHAVTLPLEAWHPAESACQALRLVQ